MTAPPPPYPGGGTTTGAKNLDIVVGIDFGTTYTGVSYAVNAGLKPIRVVESWPDPGAANAQRLKVPSVLSYNSQGAISNWGYGVESADQAIKWAKILLQPEAHYANAENTPVAATAAILVKLGKTAVDVVADFLRLVWNFTREDISKKEGADWEQIYNVRCVLTVPAMWTPAGKENTLQAAKRAGLPSQITLVTEPEAAALVILKHRADSRPTQINDAFVICDAGGGTVDLISYQVTGINPLRLKECAVGEGQLCGSTLLDVKFLKYAETMIGSEQFRAMTPKNKADMLATFEQVVKRKFKTTTNRPQGIRLRGVPDKPPIIEDGDLIVPPDALATMFDAVYLQIAALVDSQIRAVQSKALSVKGVMLAGGFGESEYLYDRLNAAHKSAEIAVLQFSGAWTAITRGATTWGLEAQPVQNPDSPGLFQQFGMVVGTTVESRLSRYSYGSAFSELFDPLRHTPAMRYIDTNTGLTRASGQMRWLLRRGDEIREGQILTQSASWTHGKTGFWKSSNDVHVPFDDALYYSEARLPPRTIMDPELKVLAKVSWNLSTTDIYIHWESAKDPTTKKKYRRGSGYVAILLGNATAQYFVVIQDQLVANVEVDFPQQ